MTNFFKFIYLFVKIECKTHFKFNQPYINNQSGGKFLLSYLTPPNFTFHTQIFLFGGNYQLTLYICMFVILRKRKSETKFIFLSFCSSSFFSSCRVILRLVQVIFLIIFFWCRLFEHIHGINSKTFLVSFLDHFYHCK